MNLRYAFRTLARTPGFTIVAILTLGLCIGANSAIYSVVDRVLLRPLPYPHPEQLAQIVTTIDGRDTAATGQNGAMWEALHGTVRALDIAAATGGFGSTGVNLTVGNHAEYVLEARVSSGYFGVLGVAPAAGREFTADEDRAGGPEAVVLSHRLWARLFNSSRDILGRTVTLRGEPHVVVGVMPDGFAATANTDVWTPVRACLACEGGGENYEFVGRLTPGATWAQASEEVARLAEDPLRQEYRSPSTHAREGIVPLQHAQTEDVRGPILILWAAVGIVLLIGCVNVAGLLVARAAARAPEIAVRMALGGGRGAIVRQLMTESLLLAAAGGAVGLFIGDTVSRACTALLGDAFAVSGDFGIDSRVFAITAAGALATSVIFGLLPAFGAARVDIRRTLVEAATPSIAGKARRWPMRSLVVVQVALSVTLLVGAGLLLRTFDHLIGLRSGFDGTHVTAATLSLEDARYRTVDRVNRFADQTIDRVHAIPGVEHAAVALTLPYERALNMGGRWVGGDPIPILNLTYVTPEYFDALRIPIVAGRVIASADGSHGAPVIVVNEAFARRSSHDIDPIGRQIVIAGGPRTVIGVVGDIQQKSGWGNFGPIGASPAAYIPLSQTNDAFLTMVHAWFSPSWIVRTSIAEQRLPAQLQSAIQAVDPTLPFAKFRTLDDVRDEAVATERAQSTLLIAFAALALLLAGVGLYGIVATSVTERTQEFGVRLALGATPRRAVAELAVPGILLALGGVALGLVIARAGAGSLRHLLWGVSAGDPFTFLMAAATALLVAAVASVIPSRRVSRLNPNRALRAQR